MWKVGTTLNDSSGERTKMGSPYYILGALNMKKTSFSKTKMLMVLHIALGENVHVNRLHKKSVQEQHIQGQYKY